MSWKEYVIAFAPLAMEIADRYGLPADALLAQSGLETGRGSNAFGNNFFGIKAGKSWTGAKQLLWTTEYIKGKKTVVQSWFRAYPTPFAGWNDYGRLVTSASIYRKAFLGYRRTGDSVQYLYDIAAAGYATSPIYAKSLITSLYTVRKYLPLYRGQRAGFSGLLVLALIGGGVYYFIKKQKENGKESSDNY